MEEEMMGIPLDDSLSPRNMSIERFEDLDWDGLFIACKEKDEQLTKAGEFGLKLCEEMKRTQDEFDYMRMKQDQEIEVFNKTILHFSFF